MKNISFFDTAAVCPVAQIKNVLYNLQIDINPFLLQTKKTKNFG